MKKRRATTGDKPAPKKTTESRRKSMYSSRPMPDSEPDVQQQPQHKRMTTKTFKVPPQQQKQRRQTTDSSKADPAPKKPPRRKTIETERVRTRQSRRKETESPPPPPPDDFEDIPNTPKPTTITAALREFKKGIDEINENDNSVPRRTNSVLCNLVQFPSQAGFSSTPEAGINFCSLTHGSVIVQLKPNASRKRSNTGDSAFVSRKLA